MPEFQVGGAVAVGEQPIKGLISPAAGARMTVAETLTNLLAAPITDIKVMSTVHNCESTQKTHVLIDY